MAQKPDSTKAKPQTPPVPVSSGYLRRVGGSNHNPLNNVLVNQTLRTLWLPPGTADDVKETHIKAAMAAMLEFKPADGVEGMMAAQAVGLHSAAMECLRRAMIPEQSGEVCDQLRRQAASLSRAFLDVVAALDRKRGKGGQQVVRVERVMVAPGGQAIVGNVQAGEADKGRDREGAGHEAAIEGEPHATAASRTFSSATPAQLAHDATPCAVLPPLWSADPGGRAVPIAGNAERPLPDARGNLNGT